MAARAHVIHDYLVSSPRPRPRARRQVWYTDDPVVLPRSSVWSAGAGLIAAAVAIGAIVTASAFAGFRPDAPVLSETPALPMLDRWQPDSLVEQANVTNLLAGPTRAVPSLDGPNNAARLDEEPIFSRPELTPAELSPETSDEQSLPGTRTLPYPGPTTTPTLPYPNPTTTPPDAVAPPDATPSTPTPLLDPENPYRDPDSI